MEEKEVNDDSLHHSLGEHYQHADPDRDFDYDDGDEEDRRARRAEAIKVRDTILNHQEDATRPVNTSLINGSVVHGPYGSDLKHHEALHEAIDTLVRNSSSGGAPHHFKVYSGVSPKHAQMLGNLKPHDTVNFPAWTSASIDKNIAHSFAGESNHVAVLNIRPGFKQGAYIGHVNHAWQGEYEFLLKPGTRWRKVGEHTQLQDPVPGSSYRRPVTYHHFEPVNETP